MQGTAPISPRSQAPEPRHTDDKKAALKGGVETLVEEILFPPPQNPPPDPNSLLGRVRDSGIAVGKGHIEQGVKLSNVGNMQYNRGVNQEKRAEQLQREGQRKVSATDISNRRKPKPEVTVLQGTAPINKVEGKVKSFAGEQLQSVGQFTR